MNDLNMLAQLFLSEFEVDCVGNISIYKTVVNNKS